MKTEIEDKPGAVTPLPVQLIRVADIVPDPKNRKDHVLEEIATLADNIRLDGLLQPIVVRRLPMEKGKTGSQYMIVAGERRWRAHMLLKRETIEARVTDATDSVLASIRKRGAENFHRVDLSPIQKADFLQELFDAKMSQPDIAAFVGAKDQSTISNFMRLRRLAPEVKAMIHDGRLSRAHGIALLRFEKFPKLVQKLAELVVEQGTPSKVLEKGLPFGAELARANLVMDIADETGYSVTKIKELPAAYREDADFMEAKNEYDEVGFYCLDLAKGKKLVTENDAAEEAADSERKKNQSKTSAKTSGAGAAAGGNKLSAKEIAERRKKIADNKANRVKATAQLTAALAKISATKKIESNLLCLVLGKMLSNHHYRGQVKAAGEKLGIKLPAGLVKSSSWYQEFNEDKLPQLSDVDMLRLGAAAVILFHGERAIEFAHGECEETTAIAGKYKAAKVVIAVGVKIREAGGTFTAAAGSASASSTSSPTAAARKAAAAYMGCAESDVDLVAAGINQYSARRKSAAKGKAAK